MKNSKEYENFDRTMHQLINVSHDELKAKLDGERAAKKAKRKVKKPYASDRASREKH
jgi:hypothetical protein